MSLEKKDATPFDDGDELPSNHSNNPRMNDLTVGLGRRQVLASGATLSVPVFLDITLPASAAPAEVQALAAEGLRGLPFEYRNRLSFEAIASGRTDTVRASVGCKATLFIPQGTPINGSCPGFPDDASNNAQGQVEQTDMYYDGMHFFLIDAQFGFGSGYINSHDLLVLNHEYINTSLLHTNGPTVVDGKRTIADETCKEINAHGVSVVEIRRNMRGERNVMPSQRNRRITAITPVHIAGPARGRELLRIRHSPGDTRVHNTYSNRSNGFTSRGTYLTCEENWVGYFPTQDNELPCKPTRYGICSTSRFGWKTLVGDEFERFDTTRKGKQAQDDYRSEPDNFGWVVEIGPFDPQSVSAKRIALGRFARESLVFAPVKPGRQIVCCSGDGSQNEYVYKYVSHDKFHPGRNNARPLDEGTLYVTRFNAGDNGQQLPLNITNGNFRAACRKARVGFADQDEMLINTRLAVDVLGATKMDRPEWGTVNPDNGDVYFTLTNSMLRTVTDAANLRVRGAYGRIVHWHERSHNYVGQRLTWDLFMLAGPGKDNRGPDGKPLNQDNILAGPDDLWFGPEDCLWTQTDIDGDQSGSGPFGNNQMLVADPRTSESERFLTDPLDCEVTGIVATPDFRTLFINIQHPREGSIVDSLLSTWPGEPGRQPRPATVMITRENGRHLF